MLNISKYKVLGMLVGGAAASYGSYEIYNQFGSSNISNLDSQYEQKALDEEELNKDILDNDEQIPENAQDNPIAQDNIVDLKPEIVNPIDNQEPRQPEIIQTPKSPEKPQETSETQQDPIRAPSIPENPKESPKSVIPTKTLSQSNRDYMQGAKNKHLHSNGTIKILQNTIGSRLQNFVITAPKDDPVGINKVSAWNDDLKYHEENKGSRRLDRNPVPQEFLLKRTEKADAEHLQRRCASSYRKTSGSDFTSQQYQYNRNTKIRQYWAIVGKYCGQADKEDQVTWYKG